MLTVLDLFSGIGGFSRGLEQTGGFRTVGFCEFDEWRQSKLKNHWPTVPIFGDIQNVSADTIRELGHIDMLTAGIPCQPFSNSGKRLGTDDERFLWPDLYWVIAEIKPRFFLFENVSGIRTTQDGLVFAGILYDLRRAGYDVGWRTFTAFQFGLFHERKRVYLFATNDHKIGVERVINKAIPQQPRLQSFEDVRRFEDLFNRSDVPQPVIRNPRDGFPDYVDRLMAIGDSVVPAIPQFIGECILEALR